MHNFTHDNESNLEYWVILFGKLVWGTIWLVIAFAIFPFAIIAAIFGVFNKKEEGLEK